MKMKCELIVAEVGKRFVAVPMKTDNDVFRGIVQLNESGAMIVNCLKEGKSTDEIVEQMLSEYQDLTRETAIDAVRSVVEKLKSVGLIEET